MTRTVEFRVRASQSCPITRRQQRGMTTLGFIILAVFVGLFAFAAIRLTPVYLNYVKVAGVVEGVFEEFDGQNPSSSMIKNSIIRRFSVESVSELEPRDITVKPESNGFMVTAEYDHTVPYIANVSFTVHFKSAKLVRR
ncbi:MAG: DUF4845 domain-containing protein [Pseudomonadota bacterium]